MNSTETSTPALTDTPTQPSVSNRIRWTGIAQRVIDYCSSEAKKISGLSLTQSRTLFHLAVYPGKRVAGIANSLNLQLTTAASAVDSVCNKGYVSKRNSILEGRRTVQYFLTEEGYAQLPRYIAGFERVFAEFAEIVGADVLEDTLRAMLPGGTIEMVLTCVDDTSLQPSNIYERLQVPQGADPDSALFDKAMYVEKVAWSLEEIDRRDPSRLPRKERLVMRALADLDGVAEVRVLRKNLVMRPATTSSALRGLQERGFVSREDDPNNRRVVIASLTAAGREAESETRPDYEAVFDECFPGFADRLPPTIG